MIYGQPAGMCVREDIDVTTNDNRSVSVLTWLYPTIIYSINIMPINHNSPDNPSNPIFILM